MMRSRLTAILVMLLVLAILPPVALAQGPLTETYTSADGTFSFNYPEGWATEELVGTILLADSQETMEAFFQTGVVVSGQVYGVILTPGALAEELGWSEIPADLDPATLLRDYMADLGEESFGEPESLVAGDIPIARATGEVDGQEADVYAIDLGPSGVAMAVLATVPGELEQYDALMLAMIGSIEAKPLTLPTETAGIVWQQLADIVDDPTSGEGYGDVIGLAVGADDTIYVADSMAGVHVYSSDGTAQRMITAEPLLGYLIGFAVAPDGTLWIVDFMGTAYNLDAEGNVLGSFDMSSQIEIAYFGTVLAVAPDGNLYFLNPKDAEETTGDAGGAVTGEVAVFSPDGTLLNSFVVGTDEYFYSGAMAFGPDGNLYVAESFTGAGVKVFDAQGNPISEGMGGGTVYSANAVAVAPDGSVYVAAPDSPIYHFAADGTLLGRFGDSQFAVEEIDFESEDFPVFAPGSFYEIAGMGVLSNGDIIIADSNPSYVQLVRIAFGE